MVGKPLKIGTRGSPLALKQTDTVRAALEAAYPGIEMQVVIIKTSGDWRPEDGEKRLSEVEGGKGLFAREIERALMEGDIDCAVHSLKDMPSFLPEGLALDHMTRREDPTDAFISTSVSSYMDLPQGAVVGTSALRRQALVLAKRPDLKIVPLRGNVQTRLAKLKEGQVDATFLAMAGLKRLGINGDFIHPIAPSDMVPACGQGCIAVETRLGDDAVRVMLDAVHHKDTGLCCWAERAALQILDGSCHTPIGAYARFEGGRMALDLVVAYGDGRKIFEESASSVIAAREEAEAFGRDIGAKLKSRVPSDIFQ